MITKHPWPKKGEGPLQPREKILHFGEEHCSDQELLTLIVGCGTRSLNGSQLAGRLLNEAGRLRGLSREC